MSTHKSFDRVCIAVITVCLIVTVLFMNGSALGIEAADRTLGYEDTLFDTSRVHTIDIVIDDWDAFIETCESETYAECAVVIDGDAVKNVAIRGKGNTSLSSVKSMGSERYSFKLEFDQYQNGKSYRGLDKLSLNNIIQDNTYMKDYLTYRMMAEFGVDSPLCSFAYLTVNGEDWGLYLAVESVEDSFLERTYGRDAGELYKPDSMSFGGGGPGNGKNFNMDDFFNRSDDDAEEGSGDATAGADAPGGPQTSGDATGSASASRPSRGGGFNFDFGGVFGGMGSGDVKLQYADDDPDSYSNIFDNAKTDVTSADKARLIESIRKLNAREDIEDVVDVDEVLRYFVVHNFVCNGDSYTGSIIHNYYLHEQDGRLSMIPWDYNLAFGTFQSSDATGTVNDPIDTPMSASDGSDRPMWGWIAQSEEYTALYHEYFADFLDSVDVLGIIDEAYALIKDYVAKDPTAFCTYEEFETGVATLRSFCEKRIASVRGQLDGTIPSTTAGQNADDSALVDAGDITLSDMGRQGSAGGNAGWKDWRGSTEAGASTDTGVPTDAAGAAPDNAGQGLAPAADGNGFRFPSGDASSFLPPMGEGGSAQKAETDEGDSSSDRPSGFPGGFGGNGGGGNFPGGGNGSFPGGGDFDPSSFGGSTGVGISAEQWITLGVCAAVLIAGLAVAIAYKRRA